MNVIIIAVHLVIVTKEYGIAGVFRICADCSESMILS